MGKQVLTLPSVLALPALSVYWLDTYCLLVIWVMYKLRHEKKYIHGLDYNNYSPNDFLKKFPIFIC